MKILLLTSSFPRHSKDPASVFLLEMARALARSGVAVRVLAPHHREVRDDLHIPGMSICYFRYLPESWQRLAYGAGIVPNLKRNPLLGWQIPFFLGAMLYRLWRECRRGGIDLIHAHWIVPQGLVGLPVSGLLRIPLLVSAHGTDTFALNVFPLGPLKRLVLRRTPAWTANTRATAGHLGLAKYHLPVPRIIPMGVRVADFAGDASMPDETLGAGRQLLYVGRLVRGKGIAYLIEAFFQLAERYRDLELVIVGDGSERDPLQRLAANGPAPERIRFLGAVPNRELGAIYRNATVFVLPSIEEPGGESEGQGVVLLEAMAAGLPVVASRAGGIPEVIDAGVNGVLVEPANSQALAGAIRELLDDPDRRASLAQAGITRVRDRYDWPVIAHRFLALYRELCDLPPD